MGGLLRIEASLQPFAYDDKRRYIFSSFELRRFCFAHDLAVHVALFCVLIFKIRVKRLLILELKKIKNK